MYISVSFLVLLSLAFRNTHRVFFLLYILVMSLTLIIVWGAMTYFRSASLKEKPLIILRYFHGAMGNSSDNFFPDPFKKLLLLLCPFENNLFFFFIKLLMFGNLKDFLSPFEGYFLFNSLWRFFNETSFHNKS